MTAVLLLADTERVKRVFADLESKGVLQLHAAATLAQVDQVVAAATPAFAFVQSRICGLSAEILLRHLKKSLPDNAKIVLLSANSADVPRKPASGTSVVDLQLADDVVAEMVADIVAGTATPTPAKGDKSAAGMEKRTEKGPRSRKDGPFGKGGSPSPRPAAATVAASPAPSPPPARGGGTKREAEGVIAATAPLPDRPASAGEASAAASAPAALPAGAPEVSTVPAPLSFLEIMEAASSKSEHEISLNAEDRVSIDSGAERGSEPLAPHSLAQSGEPPEAEPPSPAPYPLAVEELVKDAISGGGKRKRPFWPFVLLLAFFLIPSTAYLLGRVAQAPGKEAGQQSGRSAEKGSGLFAAPASATPRPPSRAATGTPPAAPVKEESAHASGLAALPPFLEGLELDRGYSARHPGWEHYLGAKAEYKVFRECGSYRAVQAIARGDGIPDQLFRRVLLEFGGIAGYAVKSTEAKGNYLVEQATGSGRASLTIYRKRDDRCIKGMVVYYH